MITADVGLASLALGKGSSVLSPRGKKYEKETIDIVLQFRYLSSVERQKGKCGKRS
ncbi:DUF188 domain-containing protein [Bacillus coahuilensis]|uniref:DUF188 domain-containing protein n=1 Tax=Bacillus coahuilensis TaxID=408580 RepID=UPI000AC3DC98|nr:DUF188 domain-containing protein [Bacillus coahuilensis]